MSIYKLKNRELTSIGIALKQHGYDPSVKTITGRQCLMVGPQVGFYEEPDSGLIVCGMGRKYNLTWARLARFAIGRGISLTDLYTGDALDPSYVQHALEGISSKHNIRFHKLEVIKLDDEAANAA